MSHGVKSRVLFGLIMIAVMVGLLWLDWWLEQYSVRKALPEGAPDQAKAWVLRGLPLAILVVLVIAVAVVELVRLCAAVGVMLLTFSAITGAAFLGTMPFWWQFLEPHPPAGEYVFLILGVICLLVFADQMIRAQTHDAIRAIACTFLAVLYLGVGTALMLAMRLNAGVPALVLFLAAVKFTDVGAYAVGSAVGRHKLVPWLSPGKTWEGLIGGVAVGAGVSMAVAAWLPTPLTWQNAAGFGAVVGLFGQFADLCESLLKRSAKVKDSGALFPSFGGVLDVIDSPLLAAPVAYMVLGILR